jgi:hypothetical protein
MRTENGEERAMVLDVTKVGDGYHESVPPYYICTLEIIVKFANNL